MDDSGREQVEAALTAAREALRRAEGAARLAGVEVGPAVVDHLTVRRIDVVEDDGTLRIVIGNSTHARTIPMRGRMVEHPGRSPSAGLLFVNDEGTECGGLQYRGHRGPEGNEQSGYLTVDDYEQNESLRLGMVQSATGSEKFVEFYDRPDWSFVDLVERPDEVDTSAAGRSRMRLARENDGSVGLVLRDARGQDRLRLVVPADGDVVVEVLDADGIPRSLLSG